MALVIEQRVGGNKLALIPGPQCLFFAMPCHRPFVERPVESFAAFALVHPLVDERPGWVVWASMRI